MCGGVLDGSATEVEILLVGFMGRYWVLCHICVHVENATCRCVREMLGDVGSVGVREVLRGVGFVGVREVLRGVGAIGVRRG